MTGAARGLTLAALVLYLLGMAVAVAWPDGWAVNRLIVRIHFWLVGTGLPVPWGPDTTAVVLNVVACIPPVAAAALLLPRVRWWWWVVAAFLLSVGVEVAQHLIGRRTEAEDVVANTAGALVGALLGRWMTRRGRTGRDESG